MTAPPGGPYGPDPSGQGPSWGGHHHPGPYPNPPGSAGPYPGYPPGAWSTGPHPYGPPPKPPRSQKPWLIGAAVAILIVLGLVVGLAVSRDHADKSAESTPSSTAGAPSSTAPAPDTSAQTATDCTENISAGTSLTADRVSAGGLSFPLNAAPGWTLYSDENVPNGIDVLGVSKEVPDASRWMMQAEVGITNFVPSMDIAAQASTLMACVAIGPGYANASPTLGPTSTSSLKVDGTDAARVDADVTIADTSRNVAGDSVTIIAVKTTPVTFFLSAVPIGDEAAGAEIDGIIAALKVKK